MEPIQILLANRISMITSIPVIGAWLSHPPQWERVILLLKHAVGAGFPPQSDLYQLKMSRINAARHLRQTKNLLSAVMIHARVSFASCSLFDKEAGTRSLSLSLFWICQARRSGWVGSARWFHQLLAPQLYGGGTAKSILRLPISVPSPFINSKNLGNSQIGTLYLPLSTHSPALNSWTDLPEFISF